MPLSIYVVTGSPVPIYQQIMDQVTEAIISGQLQEDEALPAVRVLAQQLTINVNTVVKAYALLALEGILEVRGTTGYFVPPRRQLYKTAERRRRLDPLLRSVLSMALRLGYTPEEIVEHVEDTVGDMTRPRG
jgi:GntR family transcriptional regulator